LLISRLAEFNYLDEAEQRSREQLTAESKNGTLNIDRSNFASFLKEIAVKREDWKHPRETNSRSSTSIAVMPSSLSKSYRVCPSTL
jgi:hypothetical protein